jgi:FKBP-type peptidyl-prolyl cis-trans isomerase
MHKTFRMPLLALVAVAIPVLASACVESTGISCDAVVNQQASVHGDSVYTTSGLIYRDITVGTGAAVLSTDECQGVEVRYQGRLSNGTVFSQTAAGQTAGFRVGDGGLIAGFEQGLVGMKIGGRRQLIIPPSLGYGSTPQADNQGNIVIPANSTLVFDVDLVAIY